MPSNYHKELFDKWLKTYEAIMEELPLIPVIPKYDIKVSHPNAQKIRRLAKLIFTAKRIMTFELKPTEFFTGKDLDMVNPFIWKAACGLLLQAVQEAREVVAYWKEYVKAYPDETIVGGCEAVHSLRPEEV